MRSPRRSENLDLSSNYWIVGKRFHIKLLSGHCGILEALRFKYLNIDPRVELPLNNFKSCNVSKVCQDVGCLAQLLLGFISELMEVD